MEKLYQSCYDVLTEDDELQIFEKAIVSVMPGRDDRTRKFGFIILEKLLRDVETSILRRVQARLAKRLPDISANPDLFSGLFVRQLLIKNPQVGELHSSTIDRIIFDLLDYSILNSDEDIEKIGIEIFAIRYGCSETSKIVKTVEGSIRNTLLTPEERMGMLPLGCLGVAEVREKLINVLLKLFSASLKAAKRGSKLNRDDSLLMFEKTLSEGFCYDYSLRAIATFCSVGNISVLPYIPRIVSMLIVHLSCSTAELFKTLLTISETFGASSTLYKHFFVIFSSLKKPLSSQSSSKYAVELLSSIIRSSAAIIKPEVLISVQRTVLEEVMRSDNVMFYEKILEAFLSNSHESVPLPVHVIRGLLSKRRNNSSYFLSSLCDTLTRPRLQNLTDGIISKIALVPEVETEKTVQEVESEEVFDNEVQLALDEVSEQDNVHGQCGVSKEVHQLVFSTAENTVKHITTLLAHKRELKEAAKNSSSPVKPKKVKKTEVKPTKKTVLKDGEASVDDILDSFCPS